MAVDPCKVLMICPRFCAESFWDYAETCELMNVRYPTAPLGLITVAALLPGHWDVRLINRNTQDLTNEDVAGADLVMTGGMLPQQADTLAIIDLCHSLGKPVVVGGPDATSSPHIYSSADFRVLGEAEAIMTDFITAWDAGVRSGTFTAEKFKVDVTTSPTPRFDLLDFSHYLYVGVQFSRGCPFRCEFCDIIELYGRVSRPKSTQQVLAELETLYDLGYRGHVDFVDDNLIGNKRALKAFLPELRTWLEAHDHPFEFSTEASINLADDDELLELMRQANFFCVFVGIESPAPETLLAMNKTQNTRRDLAASIHKIYAAGMFVTAGFIVGFDSEKSSVADAMIAFIEDAAIPICMVGLLYALPNTQLTCRLVSEGRLYAGHDVASTTGGDQCTAGLNFETLRPRREILDDYRRIIEKVYDPVAYAARLDRLAGLLDRSGLRRDLPQGDVRRRIGALECVHRIGKAIPAAREPFWRTFTDCGKNNPAALRFIISLMAMYLHLGPFSAHAVAKIDRMIAALDEEMVPILPGPAEASVAASG